MTMNRAENSIEIEKLYSEKETAGILRISIASLQRIRYRKEISYHRINSRVLYAHTHIENYLKKTERAHKIYSALR